MVHAMSLYNEREHATMLRPGLAVSPRTPPQVRSQKWSWRPIPNKAVTARRFHKCRRPHRHLCSSLLAALGNVTGGSLAWTMYVTLPNNLKHNNMIYKHIHIIYIYIHIYIYIQINCLRFASLADPTSNIGTSVSTGLDTLGHFCDDVQEFIGFTDCGGARVEFFVGLGWEA